MTSSWAPAFRIEPTHTYVPDITLITPNIPCFIFKRMHIIIIIILLSFFHIRYAQAQGIPYKSRSHRHVCVIRCGRRNHDPWIFDTTASNIWGVDRTDPWGPEMDHPPLGRSYLVVVPSYDMSCDFILLIWLNGSNIWGVDRTDPWGSEMDHPLLGRSYLVVVPSYDMSYALIFLTGFYGLDFMVDNDINPSSMGPIFGVWIGPTLGVSKWTIRYWAAAIWVAFCWMQYCRKI